MRTKYTALLLAALLALLCACGAPGGDGGGEEAPSASPAASGGDPSPEEAPDYTLERRLEDLEYLYDTIRTHHPDLYAAVPREVYDAEKASLAVRAETLSDVDYYHALQAFVALAGDAHTDIDLDHARISKYGFQTGLPFAVAAFEGEWRLVMADADNAQYLGMVVEAVDSTPIGRVVDLASTLISHDTDAWVEAQFSNTINFLDTLRYLGVAEGADGVTLTLRDGGDTVAAFFPALGEEEIFTWDIRALEAAVPPTGVSGAYYRFFQLGEGALFIQYNTCAEDPDLPMATFADQVREQLESGGPYSKVLVDLRYNSGGNSAVLDPLTATLDRLREEQGFSLYTLIGRNTFSSGVIGAMDLWNAGSYLVGSPTGGAVNGYGELGVDELPNFPATFYYSTKYFGLYPGYGYASLQPHLPVEQSFAGHRDGVDDVVEFVLRHDPLEEAE